jgi:hypothetical protein
MTRLPLLYTYFIWVRARAVHNQITTFYPPCVNQRTLRPRLLLLLVLMKKLLSRIAAFVVSGASLYQSILQTPDNADCNKISTGGHLIVYTVQTKDPTITSNAKQGTTSDSTKYKYRHRTSFNFV